MRLFEIQKDSKKRTLLEAAQLMGQLHLQYQDPVSLARLKHWTQVLAIFFRRQAMRGFYVGIVQSVGP